MVHYTNLYAVPKDSFDSFMKYKLGNFPNVKNLKVEQLNFNEAKKLNAIHASGPNGKLGSIPTQPMQHQINLNTKNTNDPVAANNYNFEKDFNNRPANGGVDGLRQPDGYRNGGAAGVDGDGIQPPPNNHNDSSAHYQNQDFTRSTFDSNQYESPQGHYNFDADASYLANLESDARATLQHENLNKSSNSQPSRENVNTLVQFPPPPPPPAQRIFKKSASEMALATPAQALFNSKNMLNEHTNTNFMAKNIKAVSGLRRAHSSASTAVAAANRGWRKSQPTSSSPIIEREEESTSPRTASQKKRDRRKRNKRDPNLNNSNPIAGQTRAKKTQKQQQTVAGGNNEASKKTPNKKSRQTLDGNPNIPDFGLAHAVSPSIRDKTDALKKTHAGKTK